MRAAKKSEITPKGMLTESFHGMGNRKRNIPIAEGIINFNNCFFVGFV